MHIDQGRRIQRRELKDYQQLFMLMNSLDIVDEDTRKQFVCITGPVWRRYNDATKGASQRRITVLFLSNDFNGFDELLFVGCDYVKRHKHQCCTLWDDHSIGVLIGANCVSDVTSGMAGRSVVTLGHIPMPAAGRVTESAALAA